MYLNEAALADSLQVLLFLLQCPPYIGHPRLETHIVQTTLTQALSWWIKFC